MLLFRDEEHVARWCEFRESTPGAIVSADQVCRLADGWYRDKLTPEWRRHTVEETEALLGSIGLTGAFWNLRG